MARRISLPTRIDLSQEKSTNDNDHLSTRLDRLIDSLERLEYAQDDVLRQETRTILDSFLQQVDESQEYLRENSSIDLKMIDQFHQRLTQFSHDLLLGLTIQQICDRRHDIVSISQRIDQFLYKYLPSNVNMTPTPLLRISFKDLRIDLKPLATGHFADVYRAFWRSQHDDVVIKVLHHTEDRSSHFYPIRYEHVLTVLGICFDDISYGIVTEWMPLGSLFDILHRTDEFHIYDLNWNDRQSFVLQMSQGIHYLHNFSPSIVHRNIKSSNFLVKRAEKYCVKVCDFGRSSESILWRAPELFDRSKKHTKESDMYSLGIVLWELVTRQLPWQEIEGDENEISNRVKSGRRPTMPSTVPSAFRLWIELSWHQNPEQRLTCSQLIKEVSIKMDRTPQSDESRTRTNSSISTQAAIQATEENIRSDPIEEKIFEKNSLSTLTTTSMYRIEKRRPLHRK